MSYETKQKQIAKEMQDLSGRLEIFTKSKEYSKGYSDCQKEYEEKLRWIPVEEKLPESNKIAIEFKTKKERIYYGFYGLSCNFYVMLADLLDKNIQVDEVTHWRYFYNAT